MSGFTGRDVVHGGTADGTTKVDASRSRITCCGGDSSPAVCSTVLATIPAGGATDAAGNGNTASTSTDNTVTFDPPPTVTINQEVGRASCRDRTDTIAVTDVLSENVSGFTGSGVVSCGTAGGTQTVHL